MYQSLMPKQRCLVLQCRGLGVSRPDGKHFCNVHMESAALLAPEGPKGKFEAMYKHPKAPASGLGNIPGAVHGALSHKMAYGGEIHDAVVAQSLAGY